MTRRMYVVGSVFMLALVAPVAAQQLSTSQPELKDQIQIFESILQRAVVQSGQKLAEQVFAPVPGGVVMLSTTGDALVRGVPVPQGVLFEVQVPYLFQTFVQMASRMMRPPQSAGTSQAASTPRVTANGITTPDPVAPQAPAVMDLKVRYTTIVCSSLIDSMLDHSGSLMVKDDEYLVIVASSPAQEDIVILSIKGVDLAAFRQQRISREDAVKRVVMKQF